VSTPTGRPEADRTFTRHDDGRRRRLVAGQILELRLDDNVTTGYRWVLDDEDTHVLRLDGEGHDPATSDADRAVVGASGVSWWRWTAMGPGTARVAARRLRPWEGDSSVVDRFSCRVEVRPARR
jgi:inhibitor of cysteine peptidase